MPDLTEAAERVRNARGPDATNDDFKAAYNVSGDDSLGEAFRQLEDDERLLAKAYAAELDSTLVDEQWLRENCDGIGQLSTKRLGYSVVVVNGGGPIVWYPECGPLAAYIKIPTSPHKLPATRGLVRTLQRIGGGM